MAMFAGLAAAPSDVAFAQGSAKVSVCNQSEVPIEVAVFFSVMSEPRSYAGLSSWIAIQGGQCGNVYDGVPAYVNIAFATTGPRGRTPFFTPYVGNHVQPAPGSTLSPEWLCTPAGVATVEVVDRPTAIARYLEPCGANTLVAPVSVAAFVQLRRHIRIPVSIPRARPPKPRAGDFSGIWRVTGAGVDGALRVTFTTVRDSLFARIVSNSSQWKQPVGAVFFRGRVRPGNFGADGVTIEATTPGNCRAWPALFEYEVRLNFLSNADTLSGEEENVETDNASCALKRRAGTSQRTLIRDR